MVPKTPEVTVHYEDDFDCGMSASRTLYIRNVNRHFKPDFLQEEFSKFGQLQGFDSRHLSDNYLMVEYHDLRDAVQLFRKHSTLCYLSQPGTRLDVHYTFNTKAPAPHPYENEGKILIEGFPSTVHFQDIMKTVERFGDVRRVTSLFKQPSSLLWVVEYFDTRASAEACSWLNGTAVEGRSISVTFLNGYSSWVSAGFAATIPMLPTHYLEVKNLDQLDALAESTLAQASTSTSIRRSRRFSLSSPLSSRGQSRSRSPSPTRSLSPPFNLVGDDANANFGEWRVSAPLSPRSEFGGSSAVYLPSPPSSPPARSISPPTHHPSSTHPPHHHHHHHSHHHHHPAANHHGHAAAHHGLESKHYPTKVPENFQIDLEAVRRCLDRRTTLMVRNIPNKYTQDMFLEFINETHVGLYDFIYLPIDFKNKCNVGYAFINFIDPQSIPSLFLRINGKKWTRFNSEKVCAVSYARIQGKEGLIRHFQNSTIMSECPDYRPKIFFSTGPLMGKEERFPEPNVPYNSTHFDHAPCCQEAQPKLSFHRGEGATTGLY